ncbi:uncharacterized protein isoform X2 [Rhodnius prolixus]|uniref:uncharacterized protein isoform X2 n=1 Tax=Rhodnius prolixus TaxID=13249 RepID=UPI003D18C88C
MGTRQSKANSEESLAVENISTYEIRADESQKTLANRIHLEQPYQEEKFQDPIFTDSQEQYETYSMLEFMQPDETIYSEVGEWDNPEQSLQSTENVKGNYLQEEEYTPPDDHYSETLEEINSLLVQCESRTSHLSQYLPSIASSCSLASKMTDGYENISEQMENDEYLRMEELGLGFVKDGHWVPTDVIVQTIWKKVETSMPKGRVEAKWNRSSKTFPQIRQMEIANSG